MIANAVEVTNQKRVESARDLRRYLAQLSEAAHDVVGDSRAVKVHARDADGKPVQQVEILGQGTYDLTDTARQQMADHLGIPQKFANTLLAEHPALAEANFNYLLQAKPAQRLLRTWEQGPVTAPQLRAYLSDRYRRLDNLELFDRAVAPLLDSRPDLEVLNADVTEDKLYIRLTTPKLTGLVQPGNHTFVKDGDRVQAGLVIKNSEVGGARLTVSPFVLRLVCLNGATVNDLAFAQTHLGKALTGRDFPALNRAAAKKAIKGAVIARCNLLGWAVDGADAADAAALWDFATSMESRAHQMTSLPGMFEAAR